MSSSDFFIICQKLFTVNYSWQSVIKSVNFLLLFLSHFRKIDLVARFFLGNCKLIDSEIWVIIWFKQNIKLTCVLIELIFSVYAIVLIIIRAIFQRLLINVIQYRLVESVVLLLTGRSFNIIAINFLKDFTRKFMAFFGFFHLI